MHSPDVIIAGAGIIGISLALELQQRGANVLVLDRQQPGHEASSAAAGMLAATDPETPPLLRALCLEGARLYPDFVKDIERASGIQVDFRRQGTIVIGGEPPAGAAPGDYRHISSTELQRVEPHLETSGMEACVVNEDSVDPALLMQAAVGATQTHGIEIRCGVQVQAIEASGSQVEVITDHGRLQAGAVVNCCGAWSGTPVMPRKGQMLYLQPRRPGPLEHVVRAPGAYIVPRSSGKILVGATLEDAGFDKAIDPQVIRQLHSAAARYVPELVSATVVESWAGLRPGSPDDLPLIGETATKRVFLASGHFRNGILLAPVTARIVADLIAGRLPAMDISAFAPQRFTVTTA